MTCIQYKDYTQQFKFLSKIGNGNCASVVKIQDIKNKKTYALKYAKFDTVSKLVVALQEIQVVRAIDHPVAIQIYFYFVKNNLCDRFIAKQIELGIIMELGDRSLQQDMLIRNKKQQYYTLDQIQEIVKILVNFFAFCQEKGYMHRDIKPANILIMPNIQQNIIGGNPKTTKYSKYKVCDFGFAIQNHELSDKNIAGTANYASPKIQNKFKNAQLFIKGNNFKDDVYSLGITILELCILHPIEQVSPYRFISKISNRYGLKMASFIQLMTEIYEQKRPDFINLKNLLPKHLNRKSNQIQNKFIQSFKINQNYIIENLNSPTIQYLSKINKTSISQQRTRISQSISCEQQSRLNNQEQNSIKELTQLDFVNKQHASIDIDKAQYRNRQINRCVYINSTPKINKPIEKYNKKTQQKIQKKLAFEQQFLRISTEKDKIRTKRRSKIINNIFHNQYQTDNINVKNVNNQSVVFIQKKSTSKQKYVNAIKLKQIPKSKNQHRKTNNLVQDEHILFKFENIEIQCMQIIELVLQKPKLRNISLICMVVSGKVYIVHQLFKKTEIVEIKLDKKQQIFSLDYFSKTQKFAIIFKTDNLLLIKMPILLNHLTKNQNSIPIEILAPISHQINTKNMVANQVCKKSDGIIKAFRNGDVFENNRLLLKGTFSQQIQFVRKNDQNLYLAMLNGCIYKFLISDNQVSDASKMIGYYDCKSTLIGFQIMKDQYNKESIIFAVTVSGFLLKLNLRLQLLTIKKISKNCLRACTINSNLQKGKKILAIQSNGNIVNQNGDNIYATGIMKSTKIKTINEGKNVIISNQVGTVFQIQVNRSPKYPQNQDFK